MIMMAKEPELKNSRSKDEKERFDNFNKKKR